MFDWGAQAVTQILETNSSFGLQQALDRIQKRPWLIDNLDGWLQRIEVRQRFALIDVAPLIPEAVFFLCFRF